MTGHPRPILLVDGTRLIFAPAARALARIGSRPLLPVPEPELAQRYLHDAVHVGRAPALVILRLVADDSAAVDIYDWVRKQPEPLRGVPILLITDSVVDAAQTTMDVWIEGALRPLLEGRA
jgi:hypothetical protein